MAPPVQFRVLGPLEIVVDGRFVEIGSRKQRMLLSALVAEPNRAVPADVLVGLMWAGSPPASAEVTVRSLVSRLRRALGPAAERLTGGAGGYLLRVEPDELDAERFTRLLGRARRALAERRPADAVSNLDEAIALWRGAPLLDLRDTEIGRAAACPLVEARAVAEEDLADAYLSAGRPADAIGRLEPHVTAHPLRERAWEHLMLALYRVGRQADALAAYRRVRRLLRDELGVEPNPGLRRLERRILMQDPGLDHDVAASPVRHNLPAALTPLVGRVDELAELAESLAGARLLTLTGPAGVGKTRLALQLATDVVDRFDAVHLVELASLARDGRVDLEIATALGVPGGGTELAGRVAERLEVRRVLLVLDNCEHVLAAAARIVHVLLQLCPSLTVLATSREPLGVRGEFVRSIPPLSLPAEDSSDPTQLAGSAAVTLFLQRARAAQVGFGLTADNAVAVRQICRRLDGIPLAMELAASRLRALAAHQIATRLDARFDLLTAGDRTAPPRQQTLRAAVDWSYQLLAPAQQAALRALSVFPAGFDLDAATAVIGPSGEGDEAVFRLVDKSLVVTRRRDGEVRYGLLDTIRTYGAERLAEAGERDAARARHREHYRGIVARWRRLTPANGWLGIPSTDVGNIRAAAVAALADGDGDAALQLVTCLWAIWIQTGRPDSLGLLEQALDLDGSDLVARADATVGLAFLQSWWEAGPPERSQELFTRARKLADRSGDDACRYRTYYLHGEFLAQRGDRAGAVAAYREVLGTVPPSWSAGCHNSLGWIAWSEGDTGAARAEFERAMEFGHTAAGEWNLIHAQAALAVLAAATGEPATALHLAAAAVATARHVRVPSLLVVALLRAGQTHLLCGADIAARSDLRELFTLLHRLGSQHFRAEALEAAAVLAHRAGDDRHAARWLQVADTIRVARAEVGGGVDVLGSVLALAREATRTALAGPGAGEAPPMSGAAAVADVRAWLDTGS